MAGAKKKARQERRTIIFLDESGLSQRPHRCRTWAPRGQTPVLQYHFNWKKLSAVAGLTFWRFYFQLYPGTIRGPEMIDFLRRLRRALPRRILLIWDGLAVHRCRLVRDYLASLRGAIHVAYLPPYAPELNPVEYIWGHWKQHELPNLCPADLAQLSSVGRRALARMRRRPRLITAFWKQASLFPD